MSKRNYKINKDVYGIHNNRFTVLLLPSCSSIPNTFECIFQMTVDLASGKLLHYVDERALPIKPLEERTVRDIINKLDVSS